MFMHGSNSFWKPLTCLSFYRRIFCRFIPRSSRIETYVPPRTRMALKYRIAFKERIGRESWPPNWFEISESGNDSWMFSVTDAFIDRRIELMTTLADVFGNYIRQEREQRCLAIMRLLPAELRRTGRGQPFDALRLPLRPPVPSGLRVRLALSR
jgi:hypothetical protein